MARPLGTGGGTGCDSALGGEDGARRGGAFSGTGVASNSATVSGVSLPSAIGGGGADSADCDAEKGGRLGPRGRRPPRECLGRRRPRDPLEED